MTCRRTTHGVVHNKTAQVIALEPYAKVLARTQGRMPEFVNPKYDSGALNDHVMPVEACHVLMPGAAGMSMPRKQPSSPQRV